MVSNKQIKRTLNSPPFHSSSSQVQLHFSILNSSISSTTQVAQRDGECRMWWIHSNSSEAPSSSHCSPSPAWDPTHAVQSFTNWSIMGPLHEVQSFKNRFLQNRSPTSHRLRVCKGIFAPMPGAPPSYSSSLALVSVTEAILCIPLLPQSWNIHSIEQWTAYHFQRKLCMKKKGKLHLFSFILKKNQSLYI